MQRIPIKVMQFDDEPAWSVLRRVARHAGNSTVRDLCMDFGLDHVAIENGSELDDFAARGGYDLNQLRWNSRKSNDGGFRLGDGDFLSNAFLPAGCTICPSCVKGDQNAAGQDELGINSSHWREWWSIKNVTVCPIHSVALLDLRSMFLTPSDIERILVPSDALPHDFVASPANGTAFASYVLGRIGYLPRCPHWLLDRYTVGRAISVVRHFGAPRQVYQPSTLDDEVVDNAWMERGFNILSTATRLNSHLDALFETSDPPNGNWGPRVVYGRLYDWLNAERQERNTGKLYDDLREILHRHALLTFPINPNENFFGRSMPDRNIYTLAHLWKRTGIHTTRLRAVLLKAGLIDDATAHRPDWHILVAASEVDALAEKLQGHMDRLRAMDRYGIPRGTFIALEKAGILRPWLQTGDAAEGSQIWLHEEMAAWIAQLAKDAPLAAAPPNGTLTINEAAQNAVVSVEKVVLALIDNRLQACAYLKDTRPWQAILLHSTHVRNLFDELEAIGLIGWNEAIAELETTHAYLVALIKTNRLQSTSLKGRTRKTKVCFDAGDLANFQSQWLSSKSAARHLGTHSRVVRAHLSKVGIEPAFDLKIGPASFFYQRSDVEDLPKDVFRSDRSKRHLRK